MRRLIAASLATSALAFALASVPAQAADDPSIHQIYEAASTGHLDQAQTMIEQVLRDHPESSKAHYVQAELFARESKTAAARSELARAEQLDPGLTKENQQAVRQLKSELGLAPRAMQSDRAYGGGPVGVPVAPAPSHFPLGAVLILALVVFVLWAIFRRRNYAQYPAAGPMGGPMGGPGFGGPGPGYGPGYGGGPVGGGVGSSIAGGLAGGLAAGAGIVAGEELAHHFLDGDRHEGGGVQSANAGEWNSPDPNSNMGGSDFGVNDAGSWDDSSGGGGGGGDDWT